MEQGADAVAFTNQAAQFKLLDQFQSVLGIDVVTPPLFDALGDNVVGNFTNLAYDVKLDDPVNQKFVEGMTKLSGGTPFFVQASNYTAATMLFAAIKAAGSSDTDKVRDALEGLKLDTPYGQDEMRAEDHQILVPVNVAKVVKDSSGEGYEVVASTDASTTTPEPDPACKM
jgi:ABC-type branched-subunit amino acid transport system substrate-binding protein